MKIVKITKTFSANAITHFLVLTDESYSNDDIDSLVDEWCESDLNGLSRGFHSEWSFVEDIEEMYPILESKIETIRLHVKTLLGRLAVLEKERDIIQAQIDEEKTEKPLNFIEYKGFKYWYEERPAKDRVDICLATKDPLKYCNGFYLYSDKDPGSGKCFVVVKTDNPDPNWMNNK